MALPKREHAKSGLTKDSKSRSATTIAAHRRVPVGSSPLAGNGSWCRRAFGGDGGADGRASRTDSRLYTPALTSHNEKNQPVHGPRPKVSGARLGCAVDRRGVKELPCTNTTHLWGDSWGKPGFCGGSATHSNPVSPTRCTPQACRTPAIACYRIIRPVVRDWCHR